MLRSMFAAVSGLRSHQQMMDVIGNDIANVNTSGYKASQVVFEDLLSQTLKGAGFTPGATIGGTNPAQIGLGVRVGAVETSFTQGTSQLTGRPNDVSVQGDGFLVGMANGATLYTRAGSLSFDAAGDLVTPDGTLIQGWQADSTGKVTNTGTVQTLRIPAGQVLAPNTTSTVNLGGNLPSDTAVGAAPFTASIKVNDAQGTSIPISFVFTKTAADTWSVQAQDASKNNLGNPQTLTFNPQTGALNPLASPYTVTPPGQFTKPITINFGTAGAPDSLTEFAGQPTVAALSQDGSPSGALQSFSIAPDGVITGVFSNGRTQPLGQLALANFTNPSGLERAGNTGFRATANSGNPQIGTAGSGGRGVFSPGTLEMSNVDLAQEFTNLIVAQRGFQANSKVITAADELLQDLINLKR